MSELEENIRGFWEEVSEKGDETLLPEAARFAQALLNSVLLAPLKERFQLGLFPSIATEWTHVNHTRYAHAKGVVEKSIAVALIPCYSPASWRKQLYLGASRV